MGKQFGQRTTIAQTMYVFFFFLSFFICRFCTEKNDLQRKREVTAVSDKVRFEQLEFGDVAAAIQCDFVVLLFFYFVCEMCTHTLTQKTKFDMMCWTGQVNSSSIIIIRRTHTSIYGQKIFIWLYGIFHMFTWITRKIKENSEHHIDARRVSTIRTVFFFFFIYKDHAFNRKCSGFYFFFDFFLFKMCVFVSDSA